MEPLALDALLVSQIQAVSLVMLGILIQIALSAQIASIETALFAHPAQLSALIACYALITPFAYSALLDTKDWHARSVYSIMAIE